MKNTLINVNSGKSLKKVLVCSPKNFKLLLPINHTEIRTFPKGINVNKLVQEFNGFVKKLQSLNIEVAFLPALPSLPQQTFVRDLGFTLGNKIYFGKSNVKIREGEVRHAKQILNCPNFYTFKNYLEGGDIVIFKNTVFVGISERTHIQAVAEIEKLLQNEFKIVSLKLKPKVLHLDTVMNVVGEIIVINPHGIDADFNPRIYTDKVVEISLEEQFYLPTNFLAVSPSKVIANSKCKKTNLALKALGVQVEQVSFEEMVKLGGSFRCCSLELIKN